MKSSCYWETIGAGRADPDVPFESSIVSVFIADGDW